jgi:hypothetical protein
MAQWHSCAQAQMKTERSAFDLGTDASTELNGFCIPAGSSSTKVGYDEALCLPVEAASRRRILGHNSLTEVHEPEQDQCTSRITTVATQWDLLSCRQ